jgi:predicted extracellular nuclease
VALTGVVSEYQGETELSVANAAAVTELGTQLPAVQPTRLRWGALDSDAEREAHEGELLAPVGAFTVTDNYNTNFYGEVELAAGRRMLRQPTDVGPAGSPAAQAQAAYNASHAIFLDDGSSWTYNATNHSSDPLPWLTRSTPVSDGAAVSFHQPLVLDYRNKQWNLQPLSQVSGDGSAVATFSDMRTAKAAPADVGGTARLATFNMENFFTTTGQEFVAANAGARCTYYNDRAGTPISDNTCTFADGSPGPRGAATAVAYQKQLAKELVGIDGLGASIVSLEEVENSAKFGEPRDATVAALVGALNAKDGAGTWAYVPSPTPADLPPLAEQDVIRTAFIYRPADVTPVGASHVLSDDSGSGEAFSIAREPLAQGFRAAGGRHGRGKTFMVVANHLKSKGADAAGLFSDCPGGDDSENTDPAYDQGGFNCTRVHQVKDMWAWAQEQARALGTARVFLVGDFNAYDHEDPIEYLDAQGFTDLASRYDPAHSSYSYGGLEGSLDHVLASPAALRMVTGATVWQIDAQESVAFAYSRDNYNVTQLYDATDAFATSDHDPEVVGLALPGGHGRGHGHGHGGHGHGR